MAKLNVPRQSIFTHEGAKAKHINAEQQLRRSVMSCLLWENEYYEDGESISSRIASLVPRVSAQKVADMAIEARTKMKLRHIPLFIVIGMARYDTHKHLVAKTLGNIIQRADELSEFLAIYWKDGKCPLSAQIKKGLAVAFKKFNEYQLAKYNRDGKIKLRDVLFLCHAKPENDDQDAIWKRLINNELAIPDTWEVSLSKQDGLSKKDKWEHILTEQKLGALAFLRNLRNMQEENIDEHLIVSSLQSINFEKVLPFRFIIAAKHAPKIESFLEKAMLKCLSIQEKLVGKTIILIDVSGSMDDKLSSKSEMTRLDAACGIAILIREISEKVEIFTFSNEIKQVPDRHGFALRDAIVNSQNHSGTYLGKAINVINKLDYDRLIVVTDEQSHDPVPNPKNKGYIINISSAKNGVGYGAWTHIDGFSESVISYIQEFERN